MIISRKVRYPKRVQGQNPGTFPTLKFSKFDIELINMFLCSVAKVEPLVLKRKI